MHSLAEAQEIAQNVLSRKVAVNKNEELTLDEKFAERLNDVVLGKRSSENGKPDFRRPLGLGA